jgi:hypothetical protein
LCFKRYENFTKPDVLKRLFGREDGKFNKDYLENMERRWKKWKGAQGIMEYEDENNDS